MLVLEFKTDFISLQTGECTLQSEGERLSTVRCPHTGDVVMSDERVSFNARKKSVRSLSLS